MSNTTTTKPGESLHTLTDAEKIPNPESLIEREPIENSPFWIIKSEEGWFLVMGHYRITEPTNTKEETMIKLKNNIWDVIGCMVGVIIEKYEEERMETYNKMFGNPRYPKKEGAE